MGKTDTRLTDDVNPRKILTAGVYGLDSGWGYGIMGESNNGAGVFNTTFNPEKAGVHGRTEGKYNEALGPYEKMKAMEWRIWNGQFRQLHIWKKHSQIWWRIFRHTCSSTS